MNGFKFASAVKKLGKKYRICPKCGKETDLEMKEETIIINCECGLHISADENGKVLKHTWIENGITYCGICLNKIEGDSCDCQNKSKKKKHISTNPKEQ